MDKIIDFLNLPVQMDMEDNCEYEFNDYDEFTEIYNMALQLLSAYDEIDECWKKYLQKQK